MARTATPIVGQHAPDFELSDSTGNRHTLSKLAEPNGVVLLFYRGDW